MGKKKNYELKLTKDEILHLCLIFSVSLCNETDEQDPTPITEIISKAIGKSKVDEKVYKKIYDLAKENDLDPEGVQDYSFVIQKPSVLIAALGAEDSDDEKEDTEKD